MKKILILAGFLVLPLFADPVKVEKFTIGSSEYTDASLEKMNEVVVRVTHSSGVSRIKIESLPPEIQSKLGYDPAKAMAQTEAERAAAEAAVAKAKKQAEMASRTKRFCGTIVGTTDHGVLAENRGRYAPTKPYTIPASASAAPNGMGVYHHPAEIVKPDPSLVGRPPEGAKGTVFIVGHPKGNGLVMGSVIDVDAIEEGTANYMEERYPKFRVLKVYPVK